METHTIEQELRRNAMRRRLAGEARCDICRDLKRSSRWFNKWWAQYQENPRMDFADRSRALQTSPPQRPPTLCRPSCRFANV